MINISFIGFFMTQTSKLLDDKVVRFAKEELKKIGHYGHLSKKLHAVIKAKEHGITKTAIFFGISRGSLTSWIKHLKDSNIEKLMAPPSRKRKSILSESHLRQVAKWLQDNPQITIDQVKENIESHFQVKISRSTTHRVMQKLAFSYIKPRPKHVKQDPSKIANFKKKYPAGN